jgi:uncharacterized protein (DUF427 family)
MAHIEIAPAEGVWSVRSDDAVLVESRSALALREGSREAVIYFPPGDVAMALLEPSETRTTCPHKGVARYFSYVGPGGTVADVAWSYEEPKAGAEAIGGHLAFAPGKLAVEQL